MAGLREAAAEPAYWGSTPWAFVELTAPGSALVLVLLLRFDQSPLRLLSRSDHGQTAVVKVDYLPGTLTVAATLEEKNLS
jgi:uncharacterized protein YceH (UPF0502 family)